jgi:hypothetical protein
MKKSLRDMNDDKFLKRRLGVRVEGPTKMLVAHFADDTGRIVSIVDRFRYEAIGAKVMEKGVAEKTWMLVRGSVGNSGLLKIQAIRWLEE